MLASFMGSVLSPGSFIQCPESVNQTSLQVRPFLGVIKNINNWFQVEVIILSKVDLPELNNWSTLKA